MKIGYVVKRYPRFSETFIVNEILAHEAAGLELEIFSLFPSNDTHFQDGVARVRAPVTYLDGEGARDGRLWGELVAAARVCPGLWAGLEGARDEAGREVFQAANLARLAAGRGVDHFHAHFATAATTVARLASRFSGIPYSFTAHAKDIFHESVRAADLRRKFREAAGAVTVSDFNLNHLRRQLGPEASRLRRIYNGLDLSRFPYASPEARPPRVIAVGRLVEKKGFDVLVEAAAELRRRGRSCEVLIVGGGECHPALQARIDQLGLTGGVVLAGPRPQGELGCLVQEAAVLAAPCVVGEDGNADGLPTVLIEAMALGTPCVSTDVTGIPELVRHEITGLQVPQRDPRALAGALERLLADASLRVRLAVSARALVEEEFDIHRNARLQRRVFEAGAAGRPELRRTEIQPCA